MKELELSKKLAVLSSIYHTGLISEGEYGKAKSKIMKDYNIVSLI